MLSILLLPLFVSLFISLALVSGNNLSASVGAAVGARIVSKRNGITIGSCGFVLGLLAFGENMVRTSMNLLPKGASTLLISEILLGTVIVFVLGNLIRVPLSITTSLVGLLVGVSLRDQLPLNLTFLFLVILTWISAPIISMVVAFYGNRLAMWSRATQPYSRAGLLKSLILATSFLTAFASGANTLALIVSIAGFQPLQIAIAIVAILVGCFYLSSRQIRRVGVEIIMLKYSNAFVAMLTSSIMMGIASVFGIPLSSTQTLSASVFGTGISYEKKFISAKPFIIVVVGWVMAPLLSLLIGVLI